MKNLFLNIRNLVPYIILICIYFIFINIEASNYKRNTKKIESIVIKNEKKDKHIKKVIPVIPYNQ